MKTYYMVKDLFKRGYTLQQIADGTGLSTATIWSIKNRKMDISAKSAKVIIDFYHRNISDCSVADTFAMNLVQIMDERNITVAELAKALPATQNSIYYWRNGKKPNSNTIKKIANYFKVSVDWMLTNHVPDEKINITPLLEADPEIQQTILDVFGSDDQDLKSSVLTLLKINL